jgi:transmembrane sensor
MTDDRSIDDRNLDPLRQRASAASAHVRPHWDESRAAHLIERTAARQRRERIARGAAWGTLAAAALALLAWSATDPSPPTVSSAPPPHAPVSPGVLRFADGSAVIPMEPGTEVLVDSARLSAIELELTRGAARFEVTPSLPRAFAVQAGHVRVSVVGTVFTVRRTEGEVDVEVIEGVVRVTDGDAETTLRAGERRVFRASDAVGAALPPSTSAVALAPEAGEGSELEESVTAPRVLPREDPTEDPAEETPAEETAPDGDSPDDAAHSAWTALAEEGRFDEGYALLLQDREVLRSDDIETLMEAADCARHSGHPAESLAYLFRAREVGEGDPRAAMVSFTLGRVLLSQLHRPSEAAAEFARARELAPSGSLASDALAREVEAWASSGDAGRARARAEEYLSTYPTGVHADAVRQHGGLE